MPLSYNQYNGDGTTRAFNLDFDYIAKDHVEVRVDGFTVPYTWLDTYRVQTATAPANGAIVDVRRVTPRDEILVEFMDGSVLVETDLNLATIQSFFLAQEAFDQGEASMAVTPEGHYSAGLRRISLVLDPVDDRDVVTKQWAENTTNTNVAQGIAARDAAIAAKNAAETARNDAQTARTGAQTARTGAETARTGAETAETNAAASAAAALADKNTVAADKAIVAADKATVAADKATTLGYRNDAQAARAGAETARNKAQEWADKAEDSPISPGVFSARHWAAKAQSLADSMNLEVAGIIHNAPVKSVPANLDELGLVDSASGYSMKRLTWEQLKAILSQSLDPWAFQPIGVPIPSLYGQMPSNSGSTYKYVQLTAGRSDYHGTMLTDEVLSGSAPTNTATAKINLAASPLHGMTVRLLNNENRVLRAGYESQRGNVENDALQNITGTVNSVGGGRRAFGSVSGAFATTGSHVASPPTGTASPGEPNLSFDASRVVRTANETRPKNVRVTYIMRIL